MGSEADIKATDRLHLAFMTVINCDIWKLGREISAQHSADVRRLVEEVRKDERRVMINEMRQVAEEFTAV